MDIKVRKRTDSSIELTFSDISTRTTIPLSISDSLNLQSKIMNSLKNTYAAIAAKVFEDEKAADMSILGGVSTPQEDGEDFI